MNKTNVKIFIVSTILEYFFARYIVKYVKEMDEYDAILITSLDKKLIDEKSWKSIVYFLEKKRSVFSLKNKEMAYYIKKQIENISNEYNNVYIFLPGIRNIFDNAIYKFFLKSRLNTKYIFCILPEGNYSLYYQRQDFIDKIRMYIKVFLGKIGFFPYTSFKSDRLGILNADIMYSFLPKHVKFFKGKIISIPINIVKRRKKIKKCIFLGQAIEKGMKDNYRRKIEEIGNYINYNWKDYNLYYKPHPREDLSKTWRILSKYNFQLLLDNRTIEEIVLKNNEAITVISYWSSALINLKLFLGDNIECIAYKGFEFYNIKEDEKRQIMSLYKLLNIKYVK